jgi:outer membrane biosynthesis protein TonB
MTAARNIFMVVAITASSAGLALEPDALFAKVAPGIVVVWALDSQGEKAAQGSGIVISPGEVITNCHVIKQAQTIVIEQTKRKSKARLRFRDTGRDLCQLAMEEAFGSPISDIVPFQHLKVGARVYTLGAPKGLALSFGEGLVSQLRGEEDLQYIQTTAPVSPGSSGGGLFDKDGRLIGITSFVMGGQNLNFAVPANWISDLATRHALAEKIRREEEKRDEEDAHRRADAELKQLRQEREKEAAALLRKAEQKRLEHHRRAEKPKRELQLKVRAELMEQKKSQMEATRNQGVDKEAQQRAELAQRPGYEKMVEHYANRIRAKIVPKIRVSEGTKGNSIGMFELTILPGGDVLETRLVRSSGVAAYDLAVERAILAASPLPVPGDSDVFQQEFRKFKFSFKS